MSNKIISLLCIYTQAMLSHLVMKVKAVQPVPFSFNESNWIQLGVNLCYSVLAKEQTFPHPSPRLCWLFLSWQQNSLSDVRTADVWHKAAEQMLDNEPSFGSFSKVRIISWFKFKNANFYTYSSNAACSISGQQILNIIKYAWSEEIAKIMLSSDPRVLLGLHGVLYSSVQLHNRTFSWQIYSLSETDLHVQIFLLSGLQRPYRVIDLSISLQGFKVWLGLSIETWYKYSCDSCTKLQVWPVIQRFTKPCSLILHRCGKVVM